MSNYTHPGTSVEILDGQLLTSVSIPNDATLILDVAEKGPTNRLYFVQDAKEASAVFGTNSPVVQSMQKAFRTGTKNILVYRVGGSAPILQNIFGADTYIKTTQASVTADANLRVYIGPEPTNAALDCVIVFSNDRIVYSNTLASPVDLGIVEVEGFDKEDNTVYVGSYTNPVPFSLVAEEIGDRVIQSGVGVIQSGVGKELELPVDYKPEDVSVYGQQVAVDGSRIGPAYYTIEGTPSVLKVKGNGMTATTVIDYSYIKKLQPAVIKTEDTFTEGDNKIRRIYIQTSNDATKASPVMIAKDDVSGKEVELEFTTLVSRNSFTFTPITLPAFTSFTLSVTMYDLSDPVGAYVAQFKYKTGEDLINASNKELYEAFDYTLSQLELIPVKTVVIGDYLSVPNIAYEGLNLSKVKDPQGQLDYLSIDIDEDDVRTYEWSKVKYIYKRGEGTTEDPELADITSNGQPIIYKRFNQVDFVHRIGMWAWEKNREGIYPNVVVGDKGPGTFTTTAINRWVGKSPRRNYEGQIVENGFGLLGHPLMVGTTEYSGGYFATDSGFVDGNPIPDSNGFIVDLGKYLSIVPSQTLPATSAIASTIKSGAAEYAGLIDNLAPGSGTTNSIVPNVYLATNIPAEKVKQLSEAGYVIFRNDLNRGVIVVSGDLATRENSDYDFVGTALVASSVVLDLHEVGTPFLGQGIDGIMLVNLQTALTTRMTNRQKEGWFISFRLQVIQSGPNTVQVGYTITAKDELREIASTIKLNRQLFTDING